MEQFTKQPRRKIVVLAKFEADSWDDLRGTFRHLETQLVIDGCLSKSSVSGGYSTGHIIVCSEDEAITHDSWAKELEDCLDNLAKEPPYDH